MKNESKWLKQLLSFKMMAVIVAMVVIISYLSLSATNNVINVNGKSTGNALFVQDGHTYVPLNEIAQKMGDEVNINAKTQDINIKKKNGETVSVKATQTYAIFQGKVVPLKTKMVNKTTVPVDVKAIYKNGQVYVPVEFLSSTKGMGYPVKITKENGKSIIEVGKTSTNTTDKPKEETTNQQQKPSTGKTYPDGWTAPVLQSKWSSDPTKNFQALQNELGFTEGGHFYGIKGASRAIVVNGGDSQNEVTISFYMWDGDANGQIPQAYRIPIVAKELFKLYFEGDATRVWNYFDKNDIPDTFTANGRTVKASYIEIDGNLYLQVGKKTKK